MFEDIPFAYISFVNERPPYPELMKITLESHRRFSKLPFILYLVGEAKPEWFIPHPLLHIIQLPTTIQLQSIFFYKPFIIQDALKRGLQAGYYVESDDIFTKDADLIQSYLYKIKTIPLSPIHPDGSCFPIPQGYLEAVGAEEETQPYCHGHVLFTKDCLSFIEEWLYKCQCLQGLNWDESVLNALYWKYECKEHYMPIIDEDFHHFLTPDTHPTPKFGAFVSPITIHGCKDPAQALQILARLEMH